MLEFDAVASQDITRDEVMTSTPFLASVRRT
jgi:hypothetical protein